MQCLVITSVVLLAQFRHNYAAFYTIRDPAAYNNDSMSISPRLGIDLHDGNIFWPNKTVPYKFAVNFVERHKRSVRVVFKEFKRYCVNFEEMRENDNWTKDYVKIIYGTKRGRCYADTGRIGGEQYMVYSDKHCFKLHVIRHQVLHTLGFTHEHQRPDRDCYILFKQQYDLTQENYKKNDRLTTVWPYDKNSILHYGKYQIDQFKHMSTWEAWVKNQTIRLSELDQYQVKYIYCNDPVGHPTNHVFNRDNWCNEHRAMCDEDRQIKLDCGYQPPA